MSENKVLKTVTFDKTHDEKIEYVLLENSPTIRKISNFEYSNLRSARINDLENNAPHYLPSDYNIKDMSYGEIADAEMKLKKCPYKIFREVSKIGNIVYYDLVDVNEVNIMYFLNEKL